MSSRHTIREFEEDAYYHIYNRGVEKRRICIDIQDYGVFQSYLKTYLEPKNTQELQSLLMNPDTHWKEKEKALKLLRLNNFHDSIQLLTYCLMPNHFHFLVHQTQQTSIDSFMNSFATRYAGYFNRKYKRVGPLFQGEYKAVRIQSDEQLVHVSRYIHVNPTKLSLASQDHPLRSYPYSSYQEYLGFRKSSWIWVQKILSFFSNGGMNSYESFVEDPENEENMLIKAGKCLLDE